MDRQHFTTMAHKFQSVLDEKVLNERGQALGLVKRQRLVTTVSLGPLGDGLYGDSTRPNHCGFASPVQ